MKPELSIIIVNYNVKELLKSCLASIYTTCNPEQVNVIVVDNASSDGSREFITPVFPQVMWIENKMNTGFSGANNQGMNLAKAPVILLLNPDTEIKKDAIQTLLSGVEKSEASDVVVPRLLNSDGSLQPSCWKFPGLMNIVLETFYLHTLFLPTTYSASTYVNDFDPQAASGAALMFRKSLFESIGGLDPDLFWMEDTDFCYRISKAGGKIHYVAQAEILHHSGKSSLKNLPVVITNQLISKMKYMRKHYGSFYFLISSLFIFLHLLSRCIVFSLTSIMKQEHRVKRRAYFFALRKYFGYLWNPQITLR